MEDHIDFYINGNDDYNNIISHLRTHINQVFEANNLRPPGGIIAINSNFMKGQDLYMKIYPLDPSLVFENIPPKHLNKCIQLINEDRPYKSYLHFRNINTFNKLNSIEHFHIPFADKEVIGINELDWDKLIEEIEDNPEDKSKLNMLDLSYFHSNARSFIAIPLPILSTPTILLITENNIPKESLALIIRTITFRTKDSVLFFVYNRLIKSLTSIIHEADANITNENQLIELYCQELNKVILPIKYIINDTISNFITEWPFNFHENNYCIDSEIQLSLNTHKIRFILTSFHFPINNYCQQTQWIHESESYKTGKVQTKLMLENIYNLIYEQFKNLKEIHTQTQKSAMAAIMSRNMSHNIGSHVIPGAQKLLSRGYDRRKELMLKIGLPPDALKNKDIILTDDQRDNLTLIKKEFEVDEKLLSINKHIQERMEFIADVTMAEVFMYNSIPIESVIEQFAKKDEFIKYLSGGAKVDISTMSTMKSSVISQLHASFPNDLMGVHAFYIILENIIRNTVKHSSLIKPKRSYLKNSFSLIVKISELDSNSNFYTIDIFDNLGTLNQKDRAHNNNLLLKTIQQYLDADIIDSETNKIRSGGWGMLEIRFAAAFLVNCTNKRTNNLTLLDEPLVSVGFYNSNGERCSDSYNLGFRFHIRKPYLAQCIIKNISSLIDDRRGNILANWGIHIADGNKETIDSFYSSEHQFLVTTEKHKLLYINQRVLSRYDENLFIKLLNNGDKDEIENFIWQSWHKQNWNREYLIVKNISELNTEKSTSIAFFDNHGKYLNSNGEEWISDSNFNYYEAFGSQSFTSKAIANIKEGSIRYFELQETINTKIAIIDERIQKAMDEDDSNIPFLKKYELLQMMGIYMPTKEKGESSYFSLNLESFIHHPADYKHLLEDYLISLLQDDNTRFIIIHHTIFESICVNKNKDGIEKKLSELQHKIPGNKEKSIILTSGRGTPSNLPESCYFLHFSILQDYIIYNRSKFSLVKALYSIRKRKLTNLV